MSTENNDLKWFTYTQMYVGKKFKVDNKIAHYVIIQAKNFSDANNFAEKLGIYFEGSDDNRDCRCCGDRWFRNFENGDTSPTINGIQLPLINGNFIYENAESKLIRVYPFGSITL